MKTKSEKKAESLSPEAMTVFLEVHEEISLLCESMREAPRQIEPLSQLQQRLLKFEDPRLVREDFEKWKLSCEKFEMEHKDEVPFFAEEDFTIDDLLGPDNYNDEILFEDSDFEEKN